jgi:protein SCO1/2
MVKVGKIIDDLKKSHPAMADNLVPIFVTIDPARDSIRSLREYAKDFHPEYVFLTGTPDQVKLMAKAYRVYVSKADETADGDYLVDHSIVLYLHDEGGKMQDVCTQSMKPTRGCLIEPCG